MLLIDIGYSLPGQRNPTSAAEMLRRMLHEKNAPPWKAQRRKSVEILNEFRV